MTINIKCPCCRASNKLTINNLSCRRCKEDLSLLYKIKGYSYKYRLYTWSQLMDKTLDTNNAILLHKARELCK